MQPSFKKNKKQNRFVTFCPFVLSATRENQTPSESDNLLSAPHRDSDDQHITLQCPLIAAVASVLPRKMCLIVLFGDKWQRATHLRF